MARLVLTHSTFLPGLLRLLKKLADSPKIATITPARIYHVPAKHCGPLELRLTSSISDDKSKLRSQKVLARTESSVQEVFLSLPEGEKWDPSSLSDHIRQILRKENCVIVFKPSKVH